VCPPKNTLTLGGKSLEARSAFDEWCVQHLLKALDSEGQGRLRNAATFGGAAKMLLARQGNHELQFLKHGPASSISFCNYWKRMPHSYCCKAGGIEEVPSMIQEAQLLQAIAG
jgi:hypothetical protein